MTTPHLPDQIEHLPTDTLVPYARNSRTHSPEQVAQIAASIKEFGFTNPVLIDVNTYHARTKSVFIATAHPGLCRSLRKHEKWTQISQMMGGTNGLRNQTSQQLSQKKHGDGKLVGAGAARHYGGHLRAIQGFKMTREKALSIQ